MYLSASSLSHSVLGIFSDSPDREDLPIMDISLLGNGGLDHVSFRGEI